MQIVIEILNKVKVEHENWLKTTNTFMQEETEVAYFPKWLEKKKEKSEQIVKETNEAIAVLSAYKLTKNQIENQIPKQDGN